MLSLLNLCFPTSPWCLPPIPASVCPSPPFSLPFLSFFFLTQLFLLPQRGVEPGLFRRTSARTRPGSGAQNAAAAAATVSTCSHGPTQRSAVPPVGHGASQRAEEMLGQCTEVCYYSNHCSNHGNAMEDWSGLHCRRHRVCHRGRRRSQG